VDQPLRHPIESHRTIQHLFRLIDEADETA